MNIICATLKELKEVLQIVHNTVKAVYPNYYPLEVADFFIKNHSEANVTKDIEKGTVYLITEGDRFAGTGTCDGRYISRVYILPEYQGKGYGAAIMSFLENKISGEHASVYLDSSLPSYSFYLKLGYKPIEYHRFEVENHRVLCYYVMEKEFGKQIETPVIVVD